MNPSTKQAMPTAGMMERAAAAAGLALLSPLLAAIAAAIRLEDGGPVLFRQSRAGRRGEPFGLLKFRSMRHNAGGPRITGGGDQRVTRLGRILRAYKLDELPQLWNIVRGDMSFIGPRPEVFDFVDLCDPVWRAVLSVKPGITDLATLLYRNEEQMLAGSPNPVKEYRESILPAKLALNLEYLRRRSFAADLRLLVWTVRYSFWPADFEPQRVKRTVLSTDNNS
jgi:lipopolysaccharide/colanic/teichoic acid biosynthesis glycosyltransferase